MKLKPTSSSASQTLTATKEARILVHETLRISANLASAPPPAVESNELRSYEGNLGLVGEQFVNSSLRLICFEEIDGRRWKYLAENEGSKQFKKGSIRAVSLQSPKAPAEVFLYNVNVPVVSSREKYFILYPIWASKRLFKGTSEHLL